MESRAENISEETKGACLHCDGPLPPRRTKPYIYCSPNCRSNRYYRLKHPAPEPEWPEPPSICGYCTGPCDAEREYCSPLCKGRNKVLKRVRECSRCQMPWKPANRHQETERTECWLCYIDTMTRTGREPNDWHGLKRYRKEQLAERSGNRCEDCGTKDGFFQAHHIVARALGGSHDLENLLLLCEDCHQGEGFVRHHAELIAAGRVQVAPDTQLALAA